MLVSAMVRRLPVLQSQDTDDAAAARRPPWHWVLIGGGFVITLFLPLSLLGVWLGQWLGRLDAPRGPGVLNVVLGAGPVVLSFVSACLGAGALVGRFGGKAQAREATLAGAVGAAGCWALAALGGALRPWLLAVVSLMALLLCGASAAFVGARLGQQRRPERQLR